MHLLDWIFPKQCIFCSRVGYDICDNCLKEIPRCLPCCFVCKKITNYGKTHQECFPTRDDIKIYYKRGWYISQRKSLPLSSKKSLCLNSAHKYLLNILVKSTTLSSNIVPIKTELDIDYRFNILLVKSIKREGNTSNIKDIYLVGEFLPSAEYINKQITEILKKDVHDIYIITIF